MTTLQDKSNTMSHLVVRGESALQMYHELHGHFSSEQQSYLRKLAAKRKLQLKATKVLQGE